MKNVTRELHITVVLPFPSCPEWQFRLLARIMDVDGYSVSVCGLMDTTVPRPARRDLYDWWRSSDARIFANDVQAAGQRGYEELPGNDAVHESVCQQVFRKLNELLENTGDQSADVILWLLQGVPPDRLLQKARLGVWSLSNVENDAAGFWELIEAIPVISCELFTSESNPARRRCLGRAFAKTDHLSLTRTLRKVRAIDESLVVSKLIELRRHGEVSSQLPPAEKRKPTRHRRPGMFRLIFALGQLYGRYLVKLVPRLFHRDQWQLAYRVGGGRLSQEGLTRIAPDDSGFWADPFVIRRNDHTMVFLEEMEAETGKGRIVAMEIASDGSMGPMTVVLERDFHLSYPFIFEYEDSLFMIPESADAGRIEAFRCVSFPNQWESHAVLLDNVRAFDATLLHHDGLWWMFAAVQHNGNTTCDELQLFHASNPFGEWTPHPANPVGLDLRCARPAGALYRDGDQLYRPAQDCSVRYGYGISIQRVVRLDVHEYQEETVQQILPEWDADIRGTHTVNQGDGITVYDCLAWRRKWTAARRAAD